MRVAVTGATLENGCLHVLPGSHHEPVLEHVPDRRPGANYGYTEIVDHDVDGQRPSLMDPGDLLVFDSHLMHRSTDNVSDGIRAVRAIDTWYLGVVDQLYGELEASTPLAEMAQELAQFSFDQGTFFGPAIVELPSLDLIDKEVFGLILHVVRYDPDDIETVGAALSAKGYGLTLGVHSRLEGFAERVKAAVRAGNVYVNRTIIGAVVGVQPFGGSGLSGTGPKAGGPHYLARFATERSVTVNIAAQGGDPTLLNL